jgi:DNA-binding LacI/PurR family transcriptional regulator
MRPPTLQDIADRVGVARATVSLALSGKGRMSARTRERIRSVAVELNYVPNAVARNLKISRSGSVGLYIPDNPFGLRYYLEVAYGAVRRAQESDLLVTLVPRDVPPESRFEDHLDGFVIVDPDDADPIVERLLTGGRPVVSGEWAPARLPAPRATIFTDNRRGILQLLDHVTERGARTPCCVFPPPTTSWTRAITDGYTEWARGRGVEPRIVTLTDDLTPEAIGRQIVAAAGVGSGVDAVICAADGAAVVALDALRRDGVDVGGDVLLASYVDSDALLYTTPAITSLYLDPREFGARCLDALVAVMSSPADESDEQFTVEVPMTLHLRASTARQIG